MNRRPQILFFFLLVLILSTRSIPALPKAASRSVSSIQSLSVRSFAQDKRGFMWIATDNGLCKYSGHEYLYFYPDPEAEGSLPSLKVRSLAVDSNDVLWVLTDKGLCWYDSLGDVFEVVNLDISPEGIIVSGDTLFCYGMEGTALVPTEIASFRRIDRPKKARSRPNGCISTLKGEKYSFAVMACDSAGSVWGCRSDSITVCRFDSALDESFSCSLPDKSEFHALAFDSSGNLWIGRRNGLSIISPSTGLEPDSDKISAMISACSSSDVTTILAAGNTMYVCMPGNGIYTFETDTGQLRKDVADRFSLSYMSDFCCSYYDSENHPWIGTLDRGFALRFLEKKNFSLARSVSRITFGKYINSISLSPVSKWGWVASYYKGLLSFHSRGARPRWFNYDRDPVLQSIGRKGIRSIMCDSEDRLWINMEGKVAVCKTAKGELISARVLCKGLEVNHFLEDTEGNVWMCSQCGLLKFEKKDIPSEIRASGKDEIPGVEKMTCLFKGQEVKDARLTEPGVMTIAVHDMGIYDVNLLSLQAMPSSYVPDASQALLKNPSSLHYSDGTLWVGTHNRGLFGFPSGAEVRQYSTQNGLGSDDISAILDDGAGNVYVSTACGLSIITPRYENPVTYYQGRWMDTQYFCPRSAAADGDRLFIGGNTGIAILESHRIIPNITDAPVNVVLTELRINGEPIEPCKGGVLETLIDDTHKIVLRHSQNTIGIKFDYVSFIAEDNVRFSYRLSDYGSSSEWIDAGNLKSVTFSHLPPGHYMLELASTNFDGFRSKEPRQLEIVVKESPWKSWLAIVIYILLLLLLTYLVFRILIDRRVRATELQVTREELERVSSLFSSSVSAGGSDPAELHSEEKKLSVADQNFINSVTDYIMTHMTGEPISIDTLSEEMCMSRASFFRKMKSLTGMTPSDFIMSYRLDKAASMLKDGRWRINEISDMLGFSSPSHFTKVFKNRFGVSPKDWR